VYISKSTCRIIDKQANAVANSWQQFCTTHCKQHWSQQIFPWVICTFLPWVLEKVDISVSKLSSWHISEITVTHLRMIWFHLGRNSMITRLVVKGKVQKKKLKKNLTSVSFAFTHTYTAVKTNSFRLFPQAYMETFERCAKTGNTGLKPFLPTWHNHCSAMFANPHFLGIIF